MGRSPSITVGDATGGMRVEHVKTRGVVRLVRWSASTVQDEAVGLEVSDFCARLGITTEVLGTTFRFLLVAGSLRRVDGPVVALFASEGDARADFVRLRRAERGDGAWAEVTELTAHGARPICWFGPAPPIKATNSGASLDGGPWRRPRRPFRLRWARTGGVANARELEAGGARPAAALRGWSADRERREDRCQRS